MQDLSLHILDVAENGVTAGASLIRINIEEDLQNDRLYIEIADNGRGMDPEFLAKVLDPFVTTRTTRKVGMGLSLFQQTAQEANGNIEVESRVGEGTKVTVSMSHSHIDRKPMGAMADTIVTLICGNPQVDFYYSHKINEHEFVLDTREIREELEEIPLNNPEVALFIKENVESGLNEIQPTVRESTGPTLRHGERVN
jgi:hypothetical protein